MGRGNEEVPRVIRRRHGTLSWHPISQTQTDSSSFAEQSKRLDRRDERVQRSEDVKNSPRVSVFRASALKLLAELVDATLCERKRNIDAGIVATHPADSESERVALVASSSSTKLSFRSRVTAASAAT